MVEQPEAKDGPYVMVPVPPHLVNDVMALIVRASSPEGPLTSEPPAAPAESAAVATSDSGGLAGSPHDHVARESWAAWADMPDELVERAYVESAVGGAHRQLFEFLAERPDERMTYGDVCDELGWGRRKLPAVLGTYGRRSGNRYGGQRPFHIYNDQRDVWWIWMDAHRAAIIRRLAEPARAARRQVERITELERFREVLADGAGFIVITDDAGEDPKAHSVACASVSEEHFATKVLGKADHGAYFWVPSLAVADTALGARPCRQCRPTDDPR